MRIYLLLPIIIWMNVAKSQTICNNELLHIIDTATNNQFIDVLVLTKPQSNFLKNSDDVELKFQYQNGNITSLKASISAIKRLANHKDVLRIEYSNHHIKLMNDSAHVKNRINPIKNGLAPLSQAYDGNGILIGIIDSGTDFNHPDFKDINGNSRIKKLWDMTKPVAVNTPTLYGYGQEWTNTEIDAGQCTHTDLAYYGHGTNTSGIAAGNGNSVNKYEGMAPKATIVVVALDFNRPGHTIADAVQYILTIADTLNIPCVINASVGDYYGSHDGTDLEAKMIDAMIANTPGRALVAAAGNGGANSFHVGYNLTANDTNFTWIQNNTSSFSFSIFADTLQIKNVKYRIGVTNPAFNDLAFTNYYNYNAALGVLKKDTLYYQAQRIGIVKTSASINTFGVYELAIDVIADSLNYLWNIETTGNGRIDSWNFDYVSSNLPSSATYPRITHYKLPDTQQTMVSSFQCSDEIITVANYTNRNKYTDVNNNIQIVNETSGQIHFSSSSGPTRDNRIKPDISATGSYILTSAPLSLLASYTISSPNVVAQGGFHRTAGGTSSASPVVAGLAALYFEKHPTATNQQLKQAITNCAYKDNFTGTNLPNSHWGFGKLDGFATMTCGETFDNIKISEAKNNISVFPNPFINETTLLFPNTNFKTIKLYNSEGQLIKTLNCTSNSYILQKDTLATGIYFIVVQENNTIYKIKMVIL